MEIVVAGQLQADVASLGPLQRHRQGLAVRLSQERGAVVLIRLLELLSVGRQQDQDPRGSLGVPSVAAVVQHQPVQGGGLSEVHLPPGLVLVFRVESPLAILDAVHRARRVLCGGDIAAGRCGSRIPQFQLAKPVGLQLGTRHGRLRAATAAAPRQHARHDHHGIPPTPRSCVRRHVRAPEIEETQRDQRALLYSPGAVRRKSPADRRTKGERRNVSPPVFRHESSRPETAACCSDCRTMYRLLLVSSPAR